MGRIAGDRREVRRKTALRLLVWACVAAVGLAGCDSSGSGDSELKRAEARVAVKQKALDDAKADLASKSAAFCDASASYLAALDRYGDVLSETATTVGDVKAAGEDLEQPREDTLSSADAAVNAQQQVAEAKQELQEAKADLAVAKGTASSTSPQTTSTATVAPLVPSATVDRVKQAEEDFAQAQSGISDQTPLVQASQQFNAAAVALELSWLRLFADAGCLTDEQQKQAQAAVHDYTAKLQTALDEAGYYQGDVDGDYGPATVEAVEALQKAHGLPVTGTVDKATAAALQADLAAKGGEAAQQAIASTAAVQQTLKLAGFWDGPVDGTWTPALTEALKSFQTELGVKATGAVDAATVRALERAIAEAKPEPPSPVATTRTPSPAGTSTAAPPSSGT